MNTSDQSRQQLAAEVLELGENLFEIALGAGSQLAGKEEGEAYPFQELRAATDEVLYCFAAAAGNRIVIDNRVLIVSSMI